MQVKGKNGKVFTRMQLVDPNKDMPKPEHHSHAEEGTHLVHPQEIQDSYMATKKKDYNLDTREGFVDHYVDKKMTKEDKYDMINKHGIQWTRNHASDQIDHKNAIMALKQFLVDNPHHIGAEHLPKSNAKGETLNKHKIITDWMNDKSNGDNKAKRDLIYKMLQRYGLHDGVDPNNPIQHMKNVGILKDYLADNMHLLESDEWKSDKKHDGIPDPTPTEPLEPDQMTEHQKGDNTIEGILNNMPRKRAYELMLRHGIAERDPLLNPHFVKTGYDKIAHSKNMGN